MHSANRRRSAFILASAALLLSAAAGACHSYTTVASVPDDPSIVFGPAPAVFEPGAQMAVVQGDPSVAGAPFTIRLRLPNGYKIAPHTHPTDENVTVIDGTFKVGMGNTFDENAMASVQRGGFVTAPALHAHYAKAVGATTVQVTAIGPFAITYINPNDIPKAGREMSTTINAADPVTERIRGIWTSGDFGRIAVGYAPGSAEFVARLNLSQGERVLDVACGTGNLAIPAAQAGALTTGVDIAPNLIAQANANAAKSWNRCTI